ncbi:MAG TPA: TolC family protein [Caulifigura sp.]|nr:TolC family protein [Caulifigura sp.]
MILTLSGDVNLTGVTSLDPQIAAAGIGQEEGRFNPRLASGVAGTSVHNPPSSFYGPGISTSTRYDEGTFYTRLAQPLTTGGELSAGYDPSTGYFFLPDGASSGQFNPAYSADFFFRLKQPVLKNGGAAKNLTGIRVARARADQTQWDLQSAINSQIRSLSEADWELLSARIRLQAVDSVIPLAKESVRLERLRYEAEQVILADVARAEVQVEELIRARAQAVLEFRRRNYQLNQLMGVPPATAGEVIPVDVPVRERITADSSLMSSVALQRLPELARMRKQLEIRSLQLNFAYKDRLPDVNFLGEYRTGGLSNNVNDALSQSATFGFPTWTVGVTFEYPLGNRTARSRAAAAEMELTRDQLILKTSEERATYNISKLIANLEAAWERHESASRQVQQAQEWLRLSGIRYTNPLPASRGGNWLLLALVDYQNAMRGYVEAVTAAAETLAEYNVALARLDEAQGISMDRWEIEMTDDSATRGVSEPVLSGEAFASHRVDHAASSPIQKAEFRSRGGQPAAASEARTVQSAAWQGHSSYRYQHLQSRATR